MYDLKYGQYINIQSFMIIDFGLTGNDLLVYAIIWGFSQDGENVFMGNRSYLAAWCNCSERSIQRNINNLLARGLIEQVHHSADNRSVYYKAVDTSDKLSLVTNCHQTSDKMSHVLVTKCHQTSDKMSPVYIDNIKDTLKDNIKESITVCETQPLPRFQKPTIEEVKEYAERNGKAVISAESFYNYYEANGWKVGKNPMKDWRAAFRMWEAREKKDGAPSGSGKASNVSFMENEYTKEHLAQKEADSLAELDKLLGED